MDSNASTTKQFQLLKATYSSPTNPAFVHTRSLPAPETAATSERVAYLGALRKATAILQEQINKDLTQRMEDDKATEAAKGRPVDEVKEEENYGEEVAEED